MGLTGVVVVDGLLAERGGEFLERPRLFAAEEQGAVAVADDGKPCLHKAEYAAVLDTQRW